MNDGTIKATVMGEICYIFGLTTILKCPNILPVHN